MIIIKKTLCILGSVSIFKLSEILSQQINNC